MKNKRLLCALLFVIITTFSFYSDYSFCIEELIIISIDVEAKASEAGEKNVQQEIEIPAVPEEEEILTKEMKEEDVIENKESGSTMPNKEYSIPEVKILYCTA